MVVRGWRNDEGMEGEGMEVVIKRGWSADGGWWW